MINKPQALIKAKLLSCHSRLEAGNAKIFAAFLKSNFRRIYKKRREISYLSIFNNGILTIKLQ
jgi:hypothetical protein